MSEYHVVDVPLAGREAEIVAAELWAAGATGIEERLDRLIAAFAARARADAARARVGGTVRAVAATDGLDTWRRHASVTTAGPFAVHPPWLTPPDDRIALCIDPGHAFGSGSHVSTRLALDLLARAKPYGARVADIGCGSGVLSIAAASLGATVEAVDTDPAAVAATKTNVITNGVQDRVRVTLGSAPDLAGRFRLVTINVTIDIHEALAPAVRSLSPELVVASGILTTQASRATSAYVGREVLRGQEGEWAALVIAPSIAPPSPAPERGPDDADRATGS